MREDGPEKTKQLAIGMIIVSVAGWVLWQWWFGIGFFEGKALVEGQYGSMAADMFKFGMLLVTQIGAISLGLFRVGTDILKAIAGFFFGNSDENTTTVNTTHNLRVDMPYLQPLKPGEAEAHRVAAYSASGEVLVKKDVPIFRTDENGNLVRDLALENHVCGPRTREEILNDAVDALVTGDGVRVKERFNQLNADTTPKKTPIDGKVEEDAKSTKA